MTASSTIAILLAAGRGLRAGGDIPKQYQLIDGIPVIRRTLQVFFDHPHITGVMLVVHPDDSTLYNQCLQEFVAHPKYLPVVMGGTTRQHSVFNALEAIAPLHPQKVIVHDGARPFVPPESITRVLDALQSEQHGAILALPITDTLKRATPAGTIETTLDRSHVWAAQTPQAFDFSTLLQAHQAAQQANKTDLTDDAALLEWQGHQVALIVGSPDNIKLTRPEDFDRAKTYLKHISPSHHTRTGLGYDVHAFTQGDFITLGGIKIPHNRGILAHSDGDVALHALTDALLGAICDGDIGQHFPPSNPTWRGASSDRFVTFAAARLRQSGGEILHLDITILAQAPKIAPHTAAMRAAIACAAGISEDRVSIKATTTERLGFVGREEGIAAIATATVQLPNISS